MRCRGFLIIIVCFCVLAGCNKKQAANLIAANPPQVRDPVASFKAIVQRIAAVHTTYLVEDKEPADNGSKPTPTGDPEFDAKNLNDWSASQDQFHQGIRWRRFWDSTEDQTFDIRKTDSLLSPVVAYVEFTLHEVQSARLKQSDAAMAAEDQFKYQEATRFRVDYACQDDVWVVKSVSRKDEPSEFDPDPKWMSDDYPMSIDAMRIALTDTR